MELRHAERDDYHVGTLFFSHPEGTSSDARSIRRADVGVEIEFLPDGHVDGPESLPDGRGQRPLEADPIAAEGVQGLLGDGVVHPLQTGDPGQGLLPLHIGAGLTENGQRRPGDFGSDAVAGEYRDGAAPGRAFRMVTP